MSNTISGGISFGGLGSGMDMNAIVSQLKKVQEIPVNRLKLNQAEYEYRINALEEVLKQMREANNILKGFNSPTKMLSLNIESSDSAVASATILANTELTEGSYTIDVTQLAKPSLYTSKQVFESKDAVINEGDTTETFTYTYKGKTRTIEVPPNTTLDQFMKRINNDSLNPGVKASLIKNGEGYMFQIQGKDTGKEAELSISSTLPAFDSNNKVFTGTDGVLSAEGGTFSYNYGGKQRNFEVEAGMTAQQFVEAFNKDSKQPLKANLVMDGSDYTIEFTDRRTGAKVNNLQVSTTIEGLGGKKFGSTADVVNNTDSAQKITYSFMGKNYSVSVDPQATVQDVISKINEQASEKHPDMQASFNSSTGQIEFSYKDATIKNNTDPGKDISVSFEVNGKTHNITVADGITMQEYVKQFNDYSSKNSLGVTAKVEHGADGQSKIVYTPNEGTSFSAKSDDSNAITGEAGLTTEDKKINGAFASDLEGLGKRPTISGTNSIVNSSGQAQTYSATVDGKQISFSVADGTNLEAFVEQFNKQAQTAGADVKAEIVKSGSGYKLAYTNSKGEPVQLSEVSAEGMPNLQMAGDNWHMQEAQDAIFTINGWDQEFTSSTNKLTEVIEGMEITLKSEGKTVLTVASDSSKLKDNIKEVVDAINTVKKTILELSKVDQDKETTNPEDNQMSSQLTWQKGSALTGNYGVQLLLTELNGIVTGSGGGFAKKDSIDDLFGDTFTVLSELGISTNTNAGDDDFGLLVIDEEKLDKALKEDPDAVVELLSAPLSGTTPSAEFTVASAGIVAKPGTYDVTYDVVDGQAINVKINGVLAQTDPEFPGRWTVGDPKNEAAGVAIQFPENGGMADGTGYTSEIRIRQGKINEISKFLDQELVQSSVAGVEQGKIPTIISSYKKNIENLKVKIDTETDRIALWEQREKLKFSRLEETLTKYNSKLQSISSMMMTSSR